MTKGTNTAHFSADVDSQICLVCVFKKKGEDDAECKS